MFKNFQLKNGKFVTIRDVKIEDAEQLAKFMNTVHDETNFYAYSTKEKTISTDEMKTKIETGLLDVKEKRLIAEIDGTLVGNVIIKQKSKRIRLAHRADLEVGVIKQCWGLGIGRKLVECIIDCAKDIGYEQIELIVVADNERAHNLYLSLGFEDEGMLKKGIKYSNNKYLDEYMMVKFLQEE